MTLYPGNGQFTDRLGSSHHTLSRANPNLLATFFICKGKCNHQVNQDCVVRIRAAFTSRAVGSRILILRDNKYVDSFLPSFPFFILANVILTESRKNSAMSLCAPITELQSLS